MRCAVCVLQLEYECDELCVCFSICLSVCATVCLHRPTPSPPSTIPPLPPLTEVAKCLGLIAGCEVVPSSDLVEVVVVVVVAEGC